MNSPLSRPNRRVSSSGLLGNIRITLGSQLLAAFAQFLLVVLIARHLGPEGNGSYAMAILLSTLLANFLSFGIGPATVYYVSRREFTLHQVLVGNLRLGYIVSVGGVLVSFLLILFWGERFFPGIPAVLLYLGLFSFPLTLLAAYLNAVLQGLESFRTFNLTVLLPPYVNLLGVVVVLYVLGYGAVGAMAAHLIGQLVGLTLVLALLKKDIESADLKEAKIPDTREYMRKIISYGWRAHLSNILAFVNYRADIFLVNFFMAPLYTGIYVIAVQIAERLWMLSQAASTVLLPRLSAMHGDPEARLALTSKSFWFVAGLTAVAGMVVAIALYWFITPVFGADYKEVWPAFMWLLPGIVAGAGARVQSNCIAAAGKPEWNMYVSVVIVSINIAGNILLIPEYGIVGAAWATSIAYGINAVVKFWLVRKTLGAGLA